MKDQTHHVRQPKSLRTSTSSTASLGSTQGKQMGRQKTPVGTPLDVTDSLGRQWPIDKALKAMDQKLRRRLGLAFDPDFAQASFETYCKKHFIEHGKHFDPGEPKVARAGIVKNNPPALKVIAPSFDPHIVAATFESNMRMISQGMESLQSNMPSLDIETLRELTHVMNKVLSSYKEIERLELQCMRASEFEAILDDEQTTNGVRAALSLGKYFLECGNLTEPKQLAVASWLSECAQDEFDRILAAIAEVLEIRMEVKVMLSGIDWSRASAHIEDDRRWIPLMRNPFDFNVIIGVVMGVLAGKGLSTQYAAKECTSLLFPLETVGISQGVVAMAVNKLKTKAVPPQLLLGRT